MVELEAIHLGDICMFELGAIRLNISQEKHLQIVLVNCRDHGKNVFFACHAETTLQLAFLLILLL